MARALYFDCFAGAAGDMIVGALLDAGVAFEDLRAALATLPLGGYRLAAEPIVRAGIAATKFRVEIEHAHHHPRSLGDIIRIIDGSGLSDTTKARTLRLFERLARVEAGIHRQPVETIHLHEVGAVDSIVDITGAVVALELLGVDRCLASPLNVGSGAVECAHGVLPVPAPATAELLRGVPMYSTGLEAELVTPTGALLVSEFAGEFGPLPEMRVERIGYGAGDRDLGRLPNLLRVLVGELTAAGATAETVTVIESEIDDMNPQLYAHLMERLYAAGAVEVFYAPIHMKKNRPGTLLTAVCPPGRREAVCEALFRESTTIGLRFYQAGRDKLERRIVCVRTSVGNVRLKIASRGSRVLNYAPEYEDCARLAAEHQLAVKEVQHLAIKAYLDGHLVDEG